MLPQLLPVLKLHHSNFVCCCVFGAEIGRRDIFTFPAENDVFLFIFVAENAILHRNENTDGDVPLNTFCRHE